MFIHFFLEFCYLQNLFFLQTSFAQLRLPANVTVTHLKLQFARESI